MRPSPGTFGSLPLRVSPYATNENLLAPAEADSCGSGVAGGSIARTVSDAGVTTGAALALGGTLDVEPAPVLAVGVGALVAGFVASLSRPAPQPAAANLLYNQLLREQLGRRNAEIARENAARRQAVRVTVTPLPAGAR